MSNLNASSSSLPCSSLSSASLEKNFYESLYRLDESAIPLQNDIDSLLQLAIKFEIRDYDWIGECQLQSIKIDTDTQYKYNLYNTVFKCIRKLWFKMQIDDDEKCIIMEHQLWHFWSLIIKMPEFDASIAIASSEIGGEMIVEFFSRILLSSEELIQGVYKYIIHWLYWYRIDLRPIMRINLGQKILSLRLLPGKKLLPGLHGQRTHISSLLQILLHIINGFIPPTNIIHHELLVKILLPLHSPNEFVEWRDQIPVIHEYHEALVQCLLGLINFDRNLQNVKQIDDEKSTFSTNTSKASNIFVQSINGILNLWPYGFNSNTPKEVLFLYEIEKILAEATPVEFEIVMASLLERICKCIGSETDNLRVMQKTLQIFRNEKILQLFNANEYISDLVMKSFLPALYRQGVLFWNPTVNKMTALALKKLQSMNNDLFNKYADTIDKLNFESQSKTISNVHNNNNNNNNQNKNTLPSQHQLIQSDSEASSQSTKRSRTIPLPPRPSSIDSSHSHNLKMLPPTIPTVASAKFQVQTIRPNSSQSNNTLMMGWTPKLGNPPPVTITGVAPWAVQAKPLQSPASLSSSASGRPSAVEEKKGENEGNSMSTSLSSSSSSLSSSSASTTKQSSGLQLLLMYMEKCLPGVSSSTVDGNDESSMIKEWNTAQMAPIPTLLPFLKFHDLVFGKDLGSGAFSVVKYARRIVKDKPREFWPEFAVKIISASRIKEKNYQLSVIREMAVMQLLSHPGIARLVSSFRYTQSAYLVLEFASRGDLHSLVIRNGALDDLCTRFVIGEVSAAIIYLHELGFSYNDLKPENILVTETGHVKLTDFGACRPISADASKILIDSKNILESLRNGDWRDEEAKSNDFNSSEDNKSSSFVSSSLLVEDARLEGTPAYMPPELLLGEVSFSSIASDAWALGCLTSFCLIGKPPFYGDREQVVAQILENSGQERLKKVSFDFDLHDKETMSAEACAFVLSLMTIDPSARRNVQDAIRDPYLTSGSSASQLDDKVVATSTKEITIKMDPLKLHFELPKVKLPVAEEGNMNVSVEDQQWARRQLSVLWAPMPSENINLSSTSSSSSINFSFISNNSLSDGYSFTTIQETLMERHSKF